jgi:hypothetical protein
MRPMGYHLGIKSRFLDPKEITDAIDLVKFIPNSYFFGFMSAFDTIKLEIDNNKFYFYQQNCSNCVPIKLQSWTITPQIVEREGMDARISD